MRLNRSCNCAGLCSSLRGTGSTRVVTPWRRTLVVTAGEGRSANRSKWTQQTSQTTQLPTVVPDHLAAPAPVSAAELVCAGAVPADFKQRMSPRECWQATNY